MRDYCQCRASVTFQKRINYSRRHQRALSPTPPNLFIAAPLSEQSLALPVIISNEAPRVTNNANWHIATRPSPLTIGFRVHRPRSCAPFLSKLKLDTQRGGAMGWSILNPKDVCISGTGIWYEPVWQSVYYNQTQ